MIAFIGLSLAALIGLTIFVLYQQWQIGRMFHSRTWGWFVAAYIFFLFGIVRVGWLFAEAFISGTNRQIEFSSGTAWRVFLSLAPSFGFLACKAIGNHKLRGGKKSLGKSKSPDKKS